MPDDINSVRTQTFRDAVKCVELTMCPLGLQEDMVCLSCTATGERVCLAAEGFGNRHCYLETIADKYLACLSTSSSNDKLAFDVGLQEHSQGEACWWTVHPASKQRSEGEKVRVGDDLILVSVATERYLHTAKENDVSVVNASFHVTHWSVQPYGTGISRMKYVGYVFGGDVLRFFHGGDECLTIPSTWTADPAHNIVIYEGGSVMSQARSLWRLELARTKWAGGFINWYHPMRIRHLTTGRYLSINENNELCLVAREDASLASSTFCLRQEKDDQKVVLEDKDLEVIGAPIIKYGDSTVIVQHSESSLWLSYKSYETKKKGVGKVEEKQAVLHEEGKMDDGLDFSRSQEEESRTARVIRKCSSLFNKFIAGLESLQRNRRPSLFFMSVNLNEMVMCLEDLINYFAQPAEDMEHEEKQNRLRALRNRQDLFQEEGILNLILENIDKINVIMSQGFLVALAGDESGQSWDIISGYLYQLLAAIIKGNHTNCAQFANSNRLNWLFSRLGSQASGEGSGMLDVLHCVLIDSPEALNMMRDEHIKVIISLLEKHGRDPKVLDVLCSLYVPYPGGGEKWGGNGVGDDLYSFGFDGACLWTGGRRTQVVADAKEPFIRKGDVVGCALDLTVPIITFSFNGRPVKGSFVNFNLDGMFFPVISASSKLSCRFLLGGDHGRLRYAPPEEFSALVESLLPQQTLSIDPCFYFGNLPKCVLSGPWLVEDDTAFVPQPVDTSMVTLPSYVESVRDRLAENIHEMWAMNKIEAGWMFGERRDDVRRVHPCLVPFERLPPAEKRYDSQLAVQTLKTILALGYHISMDKPPARIRNVRLPNEPFLQPNGYKPAPLDLSAVTLTAKMEELDPDMRRSPHLVPYPKVDDAIKKANRDTASETVRTLLVYGYNLDPPTGEANEGFSLNGELLMDALGGETSFSDVQGEAFVPAWTLGVGQKAKLTFGQDVNTLKFFTTCGLQEGYEPFCVNMKRAVTYWYTKDQPVFENTDDMADTRIDVTRIPAGSDSPPCLKISHNTFETMEKANWEFLRLSLPVTCHASFRGYSEDAVEADELLAEAEARARAPSRPTRPSRKGSIPRNATFDDANTLASSGDLLSPASAHVHRSTSDLGLDRFDGEGSPGRDAAKDDKKKRGRSPFRFFSRKREPSGDRLRKGRTPEPLLNGEAAPGERARVGGVRTPTRGAPQLRVSALIMKMLKVKDMKVKYYQSYYL
ncbi:LOW QUALITY PROTEIN: ryanodine receptor-like [Gryllus bimaculatus]|nr:LOW QUALITY PROTEIN: ryanodine receptor-like [Gryllus bimaculatus]